MTELSPATGLLVALLGAALVLLPTLGFGFGYDQGLLHYIASTTLQGRWPYVESWDMQAPGFLLVHVPALLLGSGPLALRLVDGVVQLAAAGLLYTAARRVAGPTAGLIAALLYAVAYVSAGYYHTAQRDGFAVPLLLGAVLALAGRGAPPTRRALAAAGIALGVACLLRPSFAVLVAAAMGALLWQGWRGRTTGDGLRAALLLGVVSALPTLLFLAVFTAAGFGAILRDTFLYIVTVYAQIDRKPPGAVLLKLLLDTPQVLWVGLLLALAGWQVALSDRDRRTAAGAPMLRAWLLGALLACIAVRLLEAKSYRYQYWPVLACAAALAGIGWSRVLAPLAQWSGAGGRIAALAVIAVLTVGIPVLTMRPIVDAARSLPANLRIALQEQPPYALLVADSDEQAAVARYLRTHTPDGAPVLLWGPVAAVHYAAGRPAPSRFLQSTAVWCVEPDDPHDYRLVGACSRPPTALQRRHLAELIADIAAVRPPVIVTATGDSLQVWDGPAFAPDFPWLRDLLAREYVIETVIGRWAVHRRRAAPPGLQLHAPADRPRLTG